MQVPTLTASSGSGSPPSVPSTGTASATYDWVQDPGGTRSGTISCYVTHEMSLSGRPPISWVLQQPNSDASAKASTSLNAGSTSGGHYGGGVSSSSWINNQYQHSDSIFISSATAIRPYFFTTTTNGPMTKTFTAPFSVDLTNSASASGANGAASATANSAVGQTTNITISASQFDENGP